MKTEISRDSHQPGKNYSGVYQQQGRMLTDADWNELVEIFKGRSNHFLKDIVGNAGDSMGGTPRHRALKIVKNAISDPLAILPGYVYIDGMAAGIPGNTAIAYDEQVDFPGSPQTVPNNCRVYVDAWERTVTHLTDARLRDVGLHGADTCTRKEVMAQIKLCPADIDPETSGTNPTQGDGELTVTLLKKTTQPDPCDPCADTLDVTSTVGNYLFRVEVHDVKGHADDPNEIVLKWSKDNGAEQFSLLDENQNAVVPPTDFIGGDYDYAYEFFSEACEKQSGVHLTAGFAPKRGTLTKGYPETVPSFSFVRQWDGFCRLKKNGGNWKVIEQFDGKTSGSSSIEFASISSGKLKIDLNEREVLLTFVNKSFVTGDFWLADVREGEHHTGSVIIENKMPSGIKHHYLTLGTVSLGKLDSTPEADRKFAFPPLTRLTRLFIAGGDGQQVAPGAPLPQPLRVGVANGEWPVQGATIRFQRESGGGSLTELNSGLTNTDGIAECNWTPGDGIGQTCRVKASLTTPGFESDETKDLAPPVYFYASLVTADKVAYEPGCTGSGGNTVHSLLKADPGVPLQLGNGYYTLKEMLDTLICKLGAKHIPYNRTLSDCWDALVSKSGADLPDTVQEAIDILCSAERGGGCCTITLSDGQDLETALKTVAKPEADLHICITAGEYTVKKPVILDGLGHITVEGCGDGTVIKAPNSETALIFQNCKSVAVRHMSISSHDLGNLKGSQFDHLNGALTLRDVDDVTVEGVFLSCPEGGKRMATCLTVWHKTKTDSVRISGCRLIPGHMQTAILLINADRVRIEDNNIKVRPRPKKFVLKHRLKDKNYRLSIRKMILSDAVVVSKGTPADKTRNVSIEYEGRSLRFKTPKNLENDWKKVKLEKANLNNRDMIRYVKKIADANLTGLASGEAVRSAIALAKVKDWFAAEKPNLPAIASQGIVCAGQIANDICITKNSISGVTQGIHIGLSHDDEKKQIYFVGRLLVEANHIENYISKQSPKDRHAIFIGNFDCVHVCNNSMELKRYPSNLDPDLIFGIRLYGYFGDMLQVRENRLVDYNKSIFARAVVVDKKVKRLWQVENNLTQGASGAPDLEPKSLYIMPNNVY